MQDFAQHMSDEELLEVVQGVDRMAKPLHQRFEGDDTPIVNLMTRLGLNQTVVDKLLVQGAVLREVAHRGLHIPRPNTPSMDAEREEYTGPKI
jgi:hypothetical protein